MGVATGDVDNDGFVDIYRTGLTESVLLHNNGNGTFTDITAKSGTANKGGWGVSASFVDIDRDGWLDLYVGNYLYVPPKGTSTACPSPGSTITVRRTVTGRSLTSCIGTGVTARLSTSPRPR